MRIRSTILVVVTVFCKTTNGSVTADEDGHRKLIGDPKTVEYKVLNMVHVVGGAADGDSASFHSLSNQESSRPVKDRCHSTTLSEEQKEALGCVTTVQRHHALDSQCRSTTLTAQQKSKLGCPDHTETEHQHNGGMSVSVSASSPHVTQTDIVSKTYSSDELCQSTQLSHAQKIKLACPDFVPETIVSDENDVEENQHPVVPNTEDDNAGNPQHSDSNSQLAAEVISKSSLSLSGSQLRQCQSPTIRAELKKRLHCPEHMIQSSRNENPEKAEQDTNPDEEHHTAHSFVETQQQQQLESSDSPETNMSPTTLEKNKDTGHQVTKKAIIKETKQEDASESFDVHETLNEDETHVGEKSRGENSSSEQDTADSHDEPQHESVQESSEEENQMSSGESSKPQHTQGDQVEDQHIPEEGGKKDDVEVDNETNVNDEKHEEDGASEPSSNDSQEESQHESVKENQSSSGESSEPQHTQGDQVEDQRTPDEEGKKEAAEVDNEANMNEEKHEEDGGKKDDVEVDNETNVNDEKHDEDGASEPSSNDSQEESQHTSVKEVSKEVNQASSGESSESQHTQEDQVEDQRTPEKDGKKDAAEVDNETNVNEEKHEEDGSNEPSSNDSQEESQEDAKVDNETHASDEKHEEGGSNERSSNDSQEESQHESVKEISEEENKTSSSGESSEPQHTQGDQVEDQRTPEEGGKKDDGDVNQELQEDDIRHHQSEESQEKPELVSNDEFSAPQKGILQISNIDMEHADEDRNPMVQQKKEPLATEPIATSHASMPIIGPGHQTNIELETADSARLPEDETSSSLRGTTRTIDADKSHSEKVKTDVQKLVSRRKFLSYVPSRWESVWKEGIRGWENDSSICEQLKGDNFQQAAFLRKYMELMCKTQRFDQPNEKWCYLQDGHHRVYYNTDEAETWILYVDQIPVELEGVTVPSGDGDVSLQQGDEDVFSKYVFLDETTGEVFQEYIEPLVSHLRFPLAQCLDDNENSEALAWFTGYIIPPPSLTRHARKLYVDVGGDRWHSLRYVVRTWERQEGGQWDIIYSLANQVAESTFFRKVPDSVREKIERHPVTVVRERTDDEGQQFLPDFISKHADNDDFVLLKLGKISPDVKESIITYMLEHPGEVHVDELIWQNNLERNYLMKNLFETVEPQPLSDLSFSETYDLFTRLRQQGIRAHAWI